MVGRWRVGICEQEEDDLLEWEDRMFSKSSHPPLPHHATWRPRHQKIGGIDAAQ